MFSAVGVIPARFGSSRLPGKPLADLQGKPLLYYVYRRALRSTSLNRVLIATDDSRVYEAARAFDANVVMTSAKHRSGTDRIAEAVEGVEASIVVNIQGDEPFLAVSAIDETVRLLKEDDQAQMSTLMACMEDPDDLWNPNVVKIITSEQGYAVYFSRSPLPYIRIKDDPNLSLSEILEQQPELLGRFHRHIGIYAYRTGFLRDFAAWRPSKLELLEDLEQLRALDHGAKIKVGIADVATTGVDTVADLERVRSLIKQHPELLEV